jgi:hypothetical protein
MSHLESCPQQALLRCCMHQRIGKGSDVHYETKINNLETNKYCTVRLTSIYLTQIEHKFTMTPGA